VSQESPGVDPEADELDRERAAASLDEAAAILDDGPHETRFVEGSIVSDAIVDASAEHDLTIVGATREGLLEQLVFGTIPERVGRRAEGTIIMAKRDLGITSRLGRLLGTR
jgi:nucleotide-binding universal stress UspA family protein